MTKSFSGVAATESHVEAAESFNLAGMESQVRQLRFLMLYISTARGSSSKSHVPPATTIESPTLVTIGSPRHSSGASTWCHLRFNLSKEKESFEGDNI